MLSLDEQEALCFGTVSTCFHIGFYPAMAVHSNIVVGFSSQADRLTNDSLKEPSYIKLATHNVESGRSSVRRIIATLEKPINTYEYTGEVKLMLFLHYIDDILVMSMDNALMTSFFEALIVAYQLYPHLPRLEHLKSGLYFCTMRKILF